nr:ABC transporter ATP-binding protein [Candidatus Brocadiales bacterium]
MSDVAIKVTNLSKRYRIGLKEELHDTFIGQVTSFIKSPISNFKRLQKLSKFGNNSEQDDVIWALKDINFEVKHGEVLGVIGANGAGKSTLLKVLAQITEPTRGRVEINGRVASLLEVGTGFHPELTGRENVYLNGTILGMTKREIDQKFDEIVDFSGIEKFIDTPVKRYSSGMRVRLAFSVAAFLEPEILLIDEVLAVGDADFQRKCLGKMENISKEGRTVLFVSHNMSAVKSLCKDAIVLVQGKLLYQNNSTDAVTYYLSSSKEKLTNEISWNIKDAPGGERLKILGVKINPAKGDLITVASGILFEFECFTTLEKSAVDVSFEILTNEGVRLTKNGYLISEPKDLVPGKYIVTAELPPFILNKGIYNLHVWYGLSGTENLAGVKEWIQFEIASAPVDHMTMEFPGVLRPKISYKRKFLQN